MLINTPFYITSSLESYFYICDNFMLLVYFLGLLALLLFVITMFMNSNNTEAPTGSGAPSGDGSSGGPSKRKPSDNGNEGGQSKKPKLTVVIPETPERTEPSVDGSLVSTESTEGTPLLSTPSLSTSPVNTEPLSGTPSVNTESPVVTPLVSLGNAVTLSAPGSATGSPMERTPTNPAKYSWSLSGKRRHSDMY